MRRCKLDTKTFLFYALKVIFIVLFPHSGGNCGLFITMMRHLPTLFPQIFKTTITEMSCHLPLYVNLAHCNIGHTHNTITFSYKYAFRIIGVHHTGFQPFGVLQKKMLRDVFLYLQNHTEIVISEVTTCLSYVLLLPAPIRH